MVFPLPPKHKNIHQPARASTPRGTKENTGQKNTQNNRSWSNRELHYDKQLCVLTTALHQLYFHSALAIRHTTDTTPARVHTHVHSFIRSVLRRHLKYEKRRACLPASAYARYLQLSRSFPPYPRHFRPPISSDTRRGEEEFTTFPNQT